MSLRVVAPRRAVPLLSKAVLATGLVLAAATPLFAQSTAPAPEGARAAPMRVHSPFADRLVRMLEQSRAEKRRVVLFVRGEEIAGVVLETGPGYVILSNQPEQEILLRTTDIDRAEFR
jgi:hypothetical protein